MTAEMKARERFVGDVAEHKMAVIRDDGLYRHVRFGRPGSSFYRFDLVTWPGYLAIVGDCEDFVFCRASDMFEFFDQPGYGINGRYGINAHYWAEKLVAPKSVAAETYSEETYRERVLQWFDDAVDQIDCDEDQIIGAVMGLRLAVSEQLLGDHWFDDYDNSLHSEHGARNRLADFEWTPPRRRYMSEYEKPRPVTLRDGTWEWDLKDYDFHFLWACWAIVWGIEQYQALKAAPVFDLSARCPRLALARSQRSVELAAA